MQEGQVEQLNDVFHKWWLLGLVGAAVVLQLISMAALSRSRKRAA